MTSQSGSGGGIPGLTSNGQVPGGAVVAGSLSVGDASAASAPSFLTARGAATITGNHASDLDNDDPLWVVNTADLTEDNYKAIARFSRGGLTNGHQRLNGIVHIEDDTAEGMVLLRGTSAVSTGPPDPSFEGGNVAFEFSPQGFLGLGGKPAPAAASTIAGNVTTGTLGDLQAVVGALLTALDAAGYVIKGTT